MKQNDENSKIYLTRSAYEEILQECSKYEGVETGTILIGMQIPAGYVVSKVFTPGPRTKRTSGSFSPDIEHVQRELDNHRALYPDEDFLGIHHQHPSWLPIPSSGDLRQAREIIGDPDYKINGRLLSLISIRANGKIELYPYHLTKTESTFQPLKMEIIKEGDCRINISHQHTLSYMTGHGFSGKESITANESSHWYETHIGKRRLKEDILSIQNEGEVLPRVIKTRDGIVIIEVRRLLIMYPPEYPINPPRFFIQKRDLQLREIYGPSSLHHWNSTRSLNDLISSHLLRRYLNDGLVRRVLVAPFRAAIGKLKRSTKSQEVKNIKQS